MTLNVTVVDEQTGERQFYRVTDMLLIATPEAEARLFGYDLDGVQVTRFPGKTQPKPLPPLTHEDGGKRGD